MLPPKTLMGPFLWERTEVFEVFGFRGRAWPIERDDDPMTLWLFSTPWSESFTTRALRRAGEVCHPNLAPLTRVGAESRYSYLAFARRGSISLRSLVARRSVEPRHLRVMATCLVSAMAHVHAASRCFGGVSLDDVRVETGPSGFHPFFADFGVRGFWAQTDAGQLSDVRSLATLLHDAWQRGRPQMFGGLDVQEVLPFIDESMAGVFPDGNRMLEALAASSARWGDVPSPMSRDFSRLAPGPIVPARDDITQRTEAPADSSNTTES